MSPGASDEVSEFEVVESSDRIRQGDVVVEIVRSGDAVAHVVVTADCDLTHGKFGGRLTALPVVTVDHYVSDFWMARELTAQREQLTTRVQEEMARLLAISELELPVPSPERLVDWPLTTPQERLAATLHLGSDALADLYELVSVIQQIDATDGSSLKVRWRTCAEAMFRNNIKSREKARAALAKRVAKELPRQLPGDVLFLNRPLDTEKVGYVALARFPVEIAPNLIARVPADELYGSTEYRRVARLASPYRYRLTQLFAEVYSAIGLPEDYESARSECFDRLATRIDSELKS